MNRFLSLFLSAVLCAGALAQSTTYPRTVNTANDLHYIPIPATPPNVVQSVVLVGFNNAEDGNGGLFWWSYNATDTPGYNAVTSTNTAYATQGRWLRFPAISPSPGGTVVNNIAGLLAITAPQYGTSYTVLGYNTPRDGGGGEFLFVNSVNYQNDGGISFPVTGGTFLRQYNWPVYPQWFGAVADYQPLLNTGTDNFNSFYRMINSPYVMGTNLQAFAGSHAEVLIPKGLYKIGSTLNLWSTNNNSGTANIGRGAFNVRGESVDGTRLFFSNTNGNALVAGAMRFRLSDLTIESTPERRVAMQSPTMTNGAGLYITDVLDGLGANGIVENVVTRRQPGHGLVIVDAVEMIRLNNVLADSNYGNGFFLCTNLPAAGGLGSFNEIFSACRAQLNNLAGWAGQSSAYSAIIGCESIINCKTNITGEPNVEMAFTNANGLVFINVDVEDVSQTFHVTNSPVSDLVFTSSGTTGTISSASSDFIAAGFVTNAWVIVTGDTTSTRNDGVYWLTGVGTTNLTTYAPFLNFSTTTPGTSITLQCAKHNVGLFLRSGANCVIDSGYFGSLSMGIVLKDHKYLNHQNPRIWNSASTDPTPPFGIWQIGTSTSSSGSRFHFTPNLWLGHTTNYYAKLAGMETTLGGDSIEYSPGQTYVQWIGSSDQTVPALNLMSNTGNKILLLERPSSDGYGLGVSGHSLQIFNNPSNRVTGKFEYVSSSAENRWWLGTDTAQSTPRASRLSGEPASGTDAASGDFTIDVSRGTGNGTPAGFAVRTTRTNNASGTTQQSISTAFSVGQSTTTTSQTAISALTYFDGSSWQSAAVNRNSGSGLLYLGSLTSTGTGASVFASGPTLTAPILGTPASVNLANGTGLPISTGVSGLGTGVATFLATPSSANLATAVTDETGTGALVFAGSPTFTGTVVAAAIAASGNITGSNLANSNNGDGMTEQMVISAALGSPMKGITVGAMNAASATSSFTLTDGRVKYMATNIPKPATITGVKFIVNTQGVFTPDNTNGIALFSQDGAGTLTKVAETANSGTIWTGTASGGIVTAAFSATYSASAGIYYLGFLYNDAGAGTAPSIRALPASASSAHTSLDYANSARTNPTLASQTTFQSPLAFSSLSLAENGLPFAWLY